MIPVFYGQLARQIEAERVQEALGTRVDWPVLRLSGWTSQPAGAWSWLAHVARWRTLPISHPAAHT
jgi:hypothetical protein